MRVAVLRSLCTATSSSLTFSACLMISSCCMVFCTVSSRSAKSIGFVRKSKAPRFMAVRMFSISPYAEMMTDLMAGLFRSLTFSRSVSPSISGMLISDRMTEMSPCSSSF